MRTQAYTLPVIDDDGSITGKRGAVIVPQRAVTLVQDWREAQVGQAVVTEEEPVEGNLYRMYELQAEYHFVEPSRIVEKMFQRVTLSPYPANRVLKSVAITAWERIS